MFVTLKKVKALIFLNHCSSIDHRMEIKENCGMKLEKHRTCPKKTL